jgi:regulator of sigma E protease
VSWLIVILGFCVLIILHELGHFSVAKAVGMRVEKFSLFFPPTLWKTRRGETEYAIGAIPAGGYVRISGMNPSEELPDEVRDRAYHAQPVWKRMAVIAAGPLVNFIVAFLLLLLFYTAFGPRDLGVGPVQKGYPAYGKLHTGDKIVAVDGKAASPANSPQLIAAHTCAGKPVAGCRATTPATLTVLRNGKRITFRMFPVYDPKAGRTRVGFAYTDNGPRKPYSFSKAASTSANNFWFITRETVKLPAYIFNAQKRHEISGIVGVSDATHKAVRGDLAVAGGHQPVPVPAVGRRTHLLGIRGVRATAPGALCRYGEGRSHRIHAGNRAVHPGADKRHRSPHQRYRSAVALI